MAEKVVISGLTAAGKTTHAKLLASALGFRAVHFTDLLMNNLDISDESVESIWFRRFHEIESMREGGSADRAADAIVGDLLSNDDPMVVDAVLAPWIHPGERVNVWLGSDRASRAWKCTVSYLPGRLSTTESLRLLDQKDALTRRYLMEEHQPDLYSDRSPFGLVIDSSHLISEPSRTAADIGIEKLHPVLLACVRFLLWDQDEDLARLAVDASDDLSVIEYLKNSRLELPRSPRAAIPSRYL